MRFGLQLGIDPWKLGRWTPAELRVKLEDEVDMRRQLEAGHWARAAWQLTYQLQPYVKKGSANKLTMEKLLPAEILVAAGLKEAPKEAPDPEDRRRMFQEIVEKFDGY